MTSDLLLTFYGDDFTGSTDALEALVRNGVETVVFLKDPTPEALAEFPNARAVGVAGVGRSLSPSAMDRELPPVFQALKQLGAPATHYKTCSTFDSSPEMGSIGRALEIGKATFDSPVSLLLVGVPRLGRYCAFGNLFARAAIHNQAEIFRLDRHPTMSRHPVTPMGESDLRRHLAKQTASKIKLFDLLRLDGDPAAVSSEFRELVNEEPDAILIDAVYDAHLGIAGRLLSETANDTGPLFVAGSSGVEYALCRFWQENGLVDKPIRRKSAAAAEQIVVVSGSCSPVTAGQIGHALVGGFGEVAVDARRVLKGGERYIRELQARATEILADGRSTIIHTCNGPDDPRLLPSSSADAADGTGSHVGHELGRRMGTLLRGLLESVHVKRIVVAGGDTSGYVAQQLGIEALTMIAPLAPGCPLCRAHVPGTTMDGLEIAFKGGQVGKPDFFTGVRDGSLP